MKFKGSKYARILCNDCQAESPPFRVYLYDDDEGDQWNGKLPDGWTTYDESELEADGMVIGGCPDHAIPDQN